MKKEKGEKTYTGFELSTLAPNSSTTQPPVELTDFFVQYLTLHVFRLIDDFIYFPAWQMQVNSLNKRIHIFINKLNSYITLGQTLNEFTVYNT